MKKVIAIALMFASLGAAAFAESPQIAVKLLEGYVNETQDAKGVNGKALGVFTAGLCLLGVAAGFWFGGDAIANSLGYQSMPLEIKGPIAASLGAAGGAVTAAGTIFSLIMPPEPAPRYKLVFDEPDPELRETFAATTIKSMADREFISRIASGAGWIAVPLVSVAATVFINTVIFRSPFYFLLPEVGAVNAPAVVASALCFAVPSKEELLWAQYQEAKASFEGEKMK